MFSLLIFNENPFNQEKKKKKKTKDIYYQSFYQIKLLGSKILGLNVLELHFVMLANHDQNVQPCFRLAQSMFMCKVGIECTAGVIV